MRTQTSQSAPSTKKPRLVRSEPHKMVVAEGDTDDEGPPEASLDRTAADNPDRPESKKEIRERENAAYLGGMRNPGKACKRVPGLRTVGRRVRRMLESFVDHHPHVLNLYEDMSRPRCELETRRTVHGLRLRWLA